MMSSYYFVLTIISSLSSSVFSMASWRGCGPPKTFAVELENDTKVFVYDAEFKFRYDRNDVAIYDYPGLNAVNLLINNTVVVFTGYVVLEEKDLDSIPLEPKTHLVFKSKIAGSARLKPSEKKTNFDEMVLTDYKLFMSRNRNEQEDFVPKRVQTEIIQEAVACVKATIDEKIGAITDSDLERGRKNPFDFGSLSVLSGRDAEPWLNGEDIKILVSAYNDDDFNSISRDGLQSTINKVVDIAIIQLVKKIEEETHGRIEIPEIHKNFTTGSSFWKVTGGFDTSQGTFVDLTSLRRTTNASVSHNGLKFIASCGFGLSTAYMQYDRYKLRYGVAKVNGKLSGGVDGVAMFATVGVDLGQEPCRAVLQDLRFTELGKIKIKVTGLGPLNKLLSKLVTWITKKWQYDITRKIENKLKAIVVENLGKLDCEKYRP